MDHRNLVLSTSMRTTTILLALLPAFVSMPRLASAQADSLQSGYIPRHNLIKVGFSSGLIETISLNYERVLNDDMSVGLTGSYMVPRRGGGLFDLQTEEISMSSNRELSGIFITPEVKWFVESNDPRTAPRGFYVGAYGRYSSMRFTAEMSASGTGTDVEGTAYGDLEIDLIEAGLGLSAGYQLLAVKDRLVFDIIFFGPRFSIYTLKIDAEFNGDGELAEDLGQALEEALGRDIFPMDVNVENSGTTSSNTSSIGYRFGIKIGYAF